VFFDLRTIAVLKRSLMPTRWNTIRSIEIYAMVYRKDDIMEAVEARSSLQLEAQPAVCNDLGSMSNLRTLKSVIGNARYLDRGYLAGGRETYLVEIVLEFLKMMQISGSTVVSLTSRVGVSEYGSSTLGLVELWKETMGSLDRKGFCIRKAASSLRDVTT
jgi:hypothetical protein